tara:strand:- start:1259 stop:1699 length:441 start_codon:yes stop_codon:yes gene_type:complete
METIGGTIRKENSNKSITPKSYYHQARTLGKRIIKGVEQMRFEYSVEPDSTFNNHHLHFYLEYPASTTQLIFDTLLSFVVADRWEEKKEWYEPSKSLETIIEARYQNHRPHYGMIELVRNIWDEKGWINYISKKDLKGFNKEVIWK